MVRDYIYRRCSTLKVMSPSSEGFKDRKKLFVVHVIVELHGGECPRVEGDRMDSVFEDDRKDRSEGIIGGVGLDDDWDVRDELGESQSRGEGLLESVECVLTIFRPDQRGGLAGEASEGDHSLAQDVLECAGG